MTDTSGSVIPGAQITVRDHEVLTAITNERGEFEITDVPRGSHVIIASLAGFRHNRRAILLPEQAKEQLKFVMRVGLVSEDPLTYAFEPREVVQKAHAIARVRIEGPAPDMFKCDELERITAILNATVIDAWKGRLPAKIQLTEEGIGRCLEDDGSVSDYSGQSHFQDGSEYIVFLLRHGRRFSVWLAPEWPVFPVNGARVATRGFMNLPESVDLPEFRDRLRRMR